MSLNTVLKIGEKFRQSPSGAGWKYHRFVKPISDEIDIYKRNKDSTGASIETTVYQLPVIGNTETGFEFDFGKMELLTDESKIKSLLYLNFKTSDKDKDKKYLFGDIAYSNFKDKKGKLVENGNYRLSTEDGKRSGSFMRYKDLTGELKGTVIGEFRVCFERQLQIIEEDLLKRHSAVIIHFVFEGGRTWLEQEGVEELIKTKILEAFVVKSTLNNQEIFALNKTLFKTIKPPIWKQDTNKFEDPDGIGATPGFRNDSSYKLKAFKSLDDIWNLMFAINFSERPLIKIRDIGIIVLPKGNNLTADQLLFFFKKTKSIQEEADNEDVLIESNEIINDSSSESKWDDFFEPEINNAFDDEIEFEVIFLKPKAGSSPAVDMIELAGIKKSHLKYVHEKIRDIKSELQEEFRIAFPKTKNPFIFQLKDCFLNILTNKTKSEKKYQSHLLKVLPQIYLDAYYEDPVLLPAFIERTEYNIRNEEKFSYNWFRYNFLFLSKIQKNKTLMDITNSLSYSIGKNLGIMARPFATWKDDCPIKSFEKNYVGNLTRRITYPEDVIKLSNFLNEKLAIHEKLYKDQQEASRQLAQELKKVKGVKYNKNECALGFFESYFERVEIKQPIENKKLKFNHHKNYQLMSTITEKSEILFLYESKYSMPNGDPFTGEQRYDEESKRILVSDVRIKRFIRDYLLELGYDIFVVNDKSLASGTESGAASRLNSLIDKYKSDLSIVKQQNTSEQIELQVDVEPISVDPKAKKGKTKVKGEGGVDVLKLLQKCIDVRLFGGISTKEGMAVNLTGPVQFALLNPSLNQSELRIHQNTSVFSSSAEKSRGSIGTTSVTPYALCQIHGWVNPFSAKHSGLEQSDLDKMFAALWHSVNNANTRSKSNQSCLLLIQIVYHEVTDKLYGTDKFIEVFKRKKWKSKYVS